MPRHSTRPGSPIEARLPSFIVEPIPLTGDEFTDKRNHGIVWVTCQRKGCGLTATVYEQAWREGRNVSVGTRTRPCPYCFKVSVIP